ncbi:hypothetical protein Pint_09362 [Pistacia integerrima]|uniref:Uncharacterized protein n=1 Tax=Pistacia integerrima TaxID=434235 RepID=A0ACC0XYX2_9ROSI|nr:hypothetical protein Pint_09362 [Pistacia integerrima]
MTDQMDFDWNNGAKRTFIPPTTKYPRIGKSKEYIPRWYQSTGMDQRVEQLEKMVQTLTGAKLQQQRTVQAYQNQFERLLAKVGSLTTERQVSYFVSRLKDSIRTEAILDDNDEDVEMETEEPSPTDTPAISLHAMTSFPNPQTMRVKGRINNRVTFILIDLGSSHNFVNKDFVDNVGLQLNHKGKFNVIVALGESLTSSGRCDQV